MTSGLPGKPAQRSSNIGDRSGSYLKSVSRRIVDRRVLHLIRMSLDSPVEGWTMLGDRLVKPAQAGPLSIVVLPFANLSGDSTQDYLAGAFR